VLNFEKGCKEKKSEKKGKKEEGLKIGPTIT
jgi:hypothetical protein